ncbi:MAG TPA: ABC transporter ATP-binding protein [Thermoprotei archaeon]|nr:MAG: ABC transporter ATP-binding protein [Thermoprotei archaeon]HDI75335.1 ABC transporter ATP-binding protein [Thermoprotei archaeon]
MSTVEVVDVSKRYGNIIALDRVSLRVEKGEYVCVLGPSGSGKSTLLKVIAGIVEPDEGEVYINGKPMKGVPLRRRNIGIVMQDILLFPHMSVWDNITYGPLVKAAPDYEEVCEELVLTMGLKLRRRALPSELSRGAQQKVAIARAVAAGARLLLLDEPLGSIDQRAAKALRVELRELVKELGLTAIHVTHNQEEALSIADKIVILRKGRIEQIGSPREIYENPASLFIVRFIGGEANFLEGVVSHTNPLEVDLGFAKVRVQSPRNFSRGDRVVLAFRPEHVVLRETPGENSIEVSVGEVSFVGKYFRVFAEVDGVDLVVKVPRREGMWIKEKSRVYLDISKAFVFKYPIEGLEAAIAYE